MLKSFEDLARDVEAFHNNVLASNELTQTLENAARQLKLSSDSFEEQSQGLSQKLRQVPAQIDAKNAAQAEEIRTSVLNEMSKTTQAISQEQEKYAAKLDATQAALDQAAQGFGEKLDGICQGLNEANAGNLEAIKGSMEEELKKMEQEMQEEYGKFSEKLQSMTTDLNQSQKTLSDKYEEFLRKLDDMNAGGIYDRVGRLEQKADSQKTLIIVMGILSILAALSRVFF